MLRLAAGARTPWVRRFGALAEVHPEVLLARALGAAVAAAGIELSDCSLLLVACDSPVGAQGMNFARRAALGLGAHEVPALTVDGQGIADLALLALANGAGRAVAVAAVDSTSVVAPGAPLVRDFGRPSPTEPTEAMLMEEIVRSSGMSASELDSASLEWRSTTTGDLDASVRVDVPSGRVVVVGDEPPEWDHLDRLDPLVGGGVVTAAHSAGLADGAAAVVLSPDAGRSVETVIAAVDPPDVSRALLELSRSAPHPIALADPSVVIHEVLRRAGIEPTSSGVGSVPALGSAPSADGLRVLIDAAAISPGGVSVIRRGRGGQVTRVDLGPR